MTSELNEREPRGGGSKPAGGTNEGFQATAPSGRVLIRIPDLTDAAIDTSPTRTVQRLLTVIRRLKRRPRAVGIGATVCLGLLVAVAALIRDRGPDESERAGLPEAPRFTADDRSSASAPSRAIVLDEERLGASAPHGSVNAGQAPSGVGIAGAGGFGGQAESFEQLLEPGVARLEGIIVPYTADANNERTRSRLH